MRLLWLLLPLALAGCVTTEGPGSVERGECKAFSAPRYEVRGATQADQDWIDPTIESGIGACKWARPAPRPVVAEPPRKATKPKRKRAAWLWHALPALAKSAPAPAVVPTPIALPDPAPPAPAPPRSALEELLHPSVQ